ncbi:hypothetical protein ES705_20769 [subsurface metagenome]
MKISKEEWTRLEELSEFVLSYKKRKLATGRKFYQYFTTKKETLVCF